MIAPCPSSTASIRPLRSIASEMACPAQQTAVAVDPGATDFAAAEAAYKRAVELAPQNDGYRQRYEALRARVAQNKKPD